MTITISEKGSTHKQIDCGSLKLRRIDCTLEDFMLYTKQGYTLSYNYADTSFSWKGHQKGGKYWSTQFICVDVDHQHYTMEEIIDKMVHKPTFCHTTFSHQKTPGDNRYHFYLCFDRLIYGEEGFNNAFKYAIEGIEDLYDKRAKSCKKLIFTTNSNNTNYQFISTGIIHTSPSEYIQADSSSALVSTINAACLDNEWSISSVSPQFLSDFSMLPRPTFIQKYVQQYPVFFETPVDFDGKPFFDLSCKDYYIVNPQRYIFDHKKKKMIRNLVQIGDRHNQLFKDAIQFKAVNPDITIEGLITALAYDVEYFYNNSDGEMTNTAILNEVEKVFSGDFLPCKSTKKLKINTNYYANTSLTIQQKIGQARKDWKDERIAQIIEENISLSDQTSLEDILLVLKENSVRITKKRLIDYCNRHGLTIPNKKEIMHQQVASICMEHPDMSSRDLESICKTMNLNVSYKTIQRIKKRLTGESVI